MYLIFWLFDYATNCVDRVENTAENIDCFFPNTADSSYLFKTFLIIYNKSSQADIAHNSVNLSHAS